MLSLFIYIRFALLFLVWCSSGDSVLVFASEVGWTEMDYRTLNFEFEVLLKTFLKEWRHLTETPEVRDLGAVLSTRSLLEKGVLEEACDEVGKCTGGDERFDGVNSDEDKTSTLPGTPNLVKYGYRENQLDVSADIGNVSEIQSAAPIVTELSKLHDSSRPPENNFVAQGMQPYLEKATNKLQEEKVVHRGRKPQNETLKENREDSLARETPNWDAKTLNSKETERQEFESHRGKRSEDGGMPVIYMPGGGAGAKKTRKCAQVNGLLGGFNTFNYLTFVTGVLTLVLNVNNNLNNNNNNNNLNNNNDISNNNVNANTNTQNANQVMSPSV